MSDENAEIINTSQFVSWWQMSSQGKDLLSLSHAVRTIVLWALIQRTVMVAHALRDESSAICKTRDLPHKPLALVSIISSPEVLNSAEPLAGRYRAPNISSKFNVLKSYWQEGGSEVVEGGSEVVAGGADVVMFLL